MLAVLATPSICLERQAMFVPTESPVNASTTLSPSLMNNSSQSDIPSLAPVTTKMDNGVDDQETSDVGVLFLYFIVVGAFILFILYVASAPCFATTRWYYVRCVGGASIVLPRGFVPHEAVLAYFR
jgi:hypothetical protein